jgi:hypothetical protein
MYIPVSYWQTQGGGIPHVRGNFWTTGFFGVPQNFSFKYDNVSISASVTSAGKIFPECLDIVNEDSYKFTNIFPAGGLFFCSATLTSSLSLPDICCINTPPNTGPEAWYFNLGYEGQGADRGTYYFSYVNAKGEIVNDTLDYNQTKTIIAQGPPIWYQSSDAFINYKITWTVGEKFLGEVLSFPYLNQPADWTFTLKRTGAGTGTQMPPFSIQQRILVNGASFIGDSGSAIGGVASSIGATTVLGTTGVPLPYQGDGGRIPPSVWITNVSPQPFGALLLSSCTSTHSLWTTLNNYNYYQTGSILKVTNSELTTTSSCWTVSNISASSAVSVALTNVNVSQSYSSGLCGECLGLTPLTATGGTTGSFLSGSTRYVYHQFNSAGTFNVISGSTTDARILVIAGGGGGGNGGGGGAGGVIYSSSISLSSVSSYNILIGSGGAAYNGTAFNTSATSGTNSSFVSGSTYNIVATGGGRGAQSTGPGTALPADNGGSGGGGRWSTGGAGSGISGQGNGGDNGITNIADGGGGGAASAGSGATGGNGRELGSLMFNSSSFYGGGGRGCCTSVPGTGSVNAGGGGNGGGGATAGGVGKPGMVVITYPLYN